MKSMHEYDRPMKWRGGKKKFVVVRRYVGPSRSTGNWLGRWYESRRKWHTYRKYKTEKSRDRDLTALQAKAANANTPHADWEYSVET